MTTQHSDNAKNEIPSTVEGIFHIHKPLQMSSQRAVQFVKYWARRESGNKKIKVGHAGTLDPLAEGVLVVAVGREYTKQIDTIVAAEKEYVAEVHFGYVSATDDAEGEKTEVDAVKVVSEEECQQACQKFIGDIEQVPPAYSAVKINGQEAYKRMRRGEEVKMQKRIVHIEEIEMISFDYPYAKLKVVCGKGTYIRSLARDIGKELGVGAYLSGLVRTRVGDYCVDNALNLDIFDQKKTS